MLSWDITFLFLFSTISLCADCISVQGYTLSKQRSAVSRRGRSCHKYLLALWMYVRMGPLPPFPVIFEKASNLNLEQGTGWNCFKKSSNIYLSIRFAWYSSDRERRVDPSMWRRLNRIGPRFTESTMEPELDVSRFRSRRAVDLPLKRDSIVILPSTAKESIFLLKWDWPTGSIITFAPLLPVACFTAAEKSSVL